MDLRKLASMTTPVTPVESAITVGVNNKILVASKVLKHKLNYKEDDDFYIAEVVDNTSDTTSIVIGSLPSNDILKTYKYNKGTTAFGDKDVATLLKGEGSEWDLEVLFDTVEISETDVRPLYLITCKVEGSIKKQNTINKYNESVKATYQQQAAVEEKFVSELAINELKEENKMPLYDVEDAPMEEGTYEEDTEKSLFN